MSAFVKVVRFGLRNPAACALRGPFLHCNPYDQASEGRCAEHDGDESPKRLRAGEFPDHSEESVDGKVEADADESAEESTQDAEDEKALLVIQPTTHPLGKTAAAGAGGLGHLEGL